MTSQSATSQNSPSLGCSKAPVRSSLIPNIDDRRGVRQPTPVRPQGVIAFHMAETASESHLLRIVGLVPCPEDHVEMGLTRVRVPLGEGHGVRGAVLEHDSV
jgi:hypothetical protein